MGTRRRPVNMEGATTHSRLRAAVSEWVTSYVLCNGVRMSHCIKGYLNWLDLYFFTSGHSDALSWASECPDVKNYKWRLNPVWHRMLYSCNHMATVGFKGLISGPLTPPRLRGLGSGPNIPLSPRLHRFRELGKGQMLITIIVNITWTKNFYSSKVLTSTAILLNITLSVKPINRSSPKTTFCTPVSWNWEDWGAMWVNHLSKVATQ